MRLAVAASGKQPTRSVLALARICEDQGIDELWLTEDYFERGAFAVAGAVLATTSRITVGIGVVNPWTRHPVLTAMETAALAEIAPGRVVLGLGASNVRWMEQQLGIPFVRPLGRLEEAVVMIRSALAGEPVVSDGLGGRVDARLAFTPPGGIPIALGVKSERALAMAGRVGDQLLLSTMSSPQYVRFVREKVGPAMPLAAYVGVSCHADAARARDELRLFAATYLGVHGDHVITRVAGIGPELAAALRAGWLSGSPRVDLVDDTMLDTFCLAGTELDVARGIDALADAGLGTLVVQPHGTGDPAELLGTLRRLVESGPVEPGPVEPAA